MILSGEFGWASLRRGVMISAVGVVGYFAGRGWQRWGNQTKRGGSCQQERTRREKTTIKRDMSLPLREGFRFGLWLFKGLDDAPIFVGDVDGVADYAAPRGGLGRGGLGCGSGHEVFIDRFSA